MSQHFTELRRAAIAYYNATIADESVRITANSVASRDRISATAKYLEHMLAVTKHPKEAHNDRADV